MPRKNTIDIFVQKAIDKHGDKYCYDKVNYIDNKTKVIILCKIHGEFTQRPVSHIRGAGCPKCAKERNKLNTETFVKKAKKIHGESYCYELVDYINSKTPVKILCKHHGLFLQQPVVHLGKHGCPDCAKIIISSKNKSTTKDFIAKASKIHENKYNYSKTIYTKKDNKVLITCPIHGDFLQVASNHLSGYGCYDCGIDSIKNKQKLGNNKFIKKANIIHNNKYRYKNTIYTNTSTKITITCPIHGDFQQTPQVHLLGHGCQKCSPCKRRDTNDFINESNIVHNFKYNYDNVIFTKVDTKVDIICPTHGLYKQTPGHHLNGHGCPGCAKTGFDINKQGLLYFVKFDKKLAEFWKIGITNNNLKSRFRKDAKNIVMSYIWKFPIGKYAYMLEKLVLKKFKDYRYNYDVDNILLEYAGDTECFKQTLSHNTVCNFIKNHPITTKKAIDYTEWSIIDY